MLRVPFDSNRILMSVVLMRRGGFEVTEEGFDLV